MTSHPAFDIMHDADAHAHPAAHLLLDSRHRIPQEDERGLELLRARLCGVLRGKAQVVELLLAGLLARGHVLIEDLPGLGKTTLAKALAQSVGARFARVQCTPDLLPTDISGFNIFNQQTQRLEFLPGPVFADILLIDEINRATPRTQSALLEAMAERQVTVDTVCHRLAPSFFVIATQNPLEEHGTYPLPEAQLDRFAIRLNIGYAPPDQERAMLADAVTHSESNANPKPPCMSLAAIEAVQKRVAAVYVSPRLQAYLVDVAVATRKHAGLRAGISPRGLLTWQRVSQAWAYLQGRTFVTPDDLAGVALHVLSIRLTALEGNTEAVLAEVFDRVPLPPYEEHRS